MIFLLYSNQPIVSKNSVTTLTLVTQICPFHLRKKKRTENLFFRCRNLTKNGEFVTTVYRKLTFSGIYAHFESFLPSTHKIRMLYLNI